MRPSAPLRVGRQPELDVLGGLCIDVRLDQDLGRGRDPSARAGGQLCLGRVGGERRGRAERQDDGARECRSQMS